MSRAESTERVVRGQTTRSAAQLQPPGNSGILVSYARYGSILFFVWLFGLAAQRHLLSGTGDATKTQAARFVELPRRAWGIAIAL